jgi:hypothetical protein
VITYDELLNRLKKLYGLEYVNTEEVVPAEDDADKPIDLDEIPF